MKRSRLSEFIAVAEAGSLRVAAKRLGMSQPAVSKAIQALEEEYGVELFVRSVRGVALTQFGNMLLPRAKRIESELRFAKQELADLQGVKGGAISVAVAPVVAAGMIPAALRELRNRGYRGLTTIVDGQHPSGISLLRASNVDVFVGPVPVGEVPRDIEIETLCANPAHVICRTGHPLENSTKLADLVDAHWAFGGTLGMRGQFLHHLFERDGLPLPKSNLQCESFLALLSLVADSDLLTILPVRMMNRKPFGSVYRSIPLEERIELPGISIATRAGSPISPAGKAFVTAIRHASRALNRDGT